VQKLCAGARKQSVSESVTGYQLKLGTTMKCYKQVIPWDDLLRPIPSHAEPCYQTSLSLYNSDKEFIENEKEQVGHIEDINKFTYINHEFDKKIVVLDLVKID
jgi:hypothetical protein